MLHIIYAVAFSPALMRMLRPAVAKGVDGEGVETGGGGGVRGKVVGGGGVEAEGCGLGEFGGGVGS